MDLNTLNMIVMIIFPIVIIGTIIWICIWNSATFKKKTIFIVLVSLIAFMIVALTLNEISIDKYQEQNLRFKISQSNKYTDDEKMKLIDDIHSYNCRLDRWNNTPNFIKNILGSITNCEYLYELNKIEYELIIEEE